MSKNLVITGASGFAGSHILQEFDNNIERDYKLIAACRNRNTLPTKYQDVAIVGDLRDKTYVDKITKKADIICHAAAWAELNGKNKNSKVKFLNPTLQLIDSALKNGVKRFIFLSAITSNPIIKQNLHSKLPLYKIWAHYNNVIKIERYLEDISKKGIEVIILRAGLFTGKNYALGILPILLPRLKTHLVPWIENGKTSLPLIDGQDLGLAFRLSTIANVESNYHTIDIVGKDTPTVEKVFTYLHKKHNYPLPHFSVSFNIAYIFARFMRFVHKFIPSDPLIVPSIVLLLEETYANNEKAKSILNYEAKINWRDSIDMQISEFNVRQEKNMRMNKYEID